MALLITRACCGGSKPNVAQPASNPTAPNRIIHVSVEGWRDIQHSYAVVNQFQLLELIKRPDVRVSVVDMPFYRSWWRKTSGLFNAEQAAVLAALPLTNHSSHNDRPHVILRVTFPMDLRPAPRRIPTWVFGTTELLIPINAMRGSGSPPWSALGGVDPFVGVVTPSHWSLRGFRRGGVAASRLRVVPHGVDPAVFRPASAARRTELRRKLGWKGRTVFLSVGSRIGSKGLPDLLRAFRPLHDSYPRAKLVLKLADSVYNSSRQHVELVRSQHLVDSGAIEYIGTSLSFEHMAELYQAADVYVSPYRGEGFNIPVLEAAACGLPVVVTKGGATEDFVLPSFALKVAAEERPVSVEGGAQTGQWLVPNVEHLRQQMQHAMHDEKLVARARREAPSHVHTHFSWTAAVERLVAVFREGIQEQATANRALSEESCFE